MTRVTPAVEKALKELQPGDRVRDRGRTHARNVDGLAGLREGWRDWLGIWDEYRVEVDEYRELDSEHVLVLLRQMGCGKKSGLPVTNSGTNLLNIRDGKVTRLALCTDRARSLADLGLTPDTGT